MKTQYLEKVHYALRSLWLVPAVVLLSVSCKEEPIGQYPVDNTPPQRISNPVVANLKGGALITYDLPSEKDLLYVKAEYTLPNGQKKEMRTSAYTNTIRIDGFSRSTKAPVYLICVDRSRNESEPVRCEIEPLDSPIFDVFNTINVIAGFGGLKLEWQNPDKANVVVGVVIKNEDNDYEPIDNFYSSVENGLGTVRGLAPEEKNFGIFVRDIYFNYTDTIFTTLTPWEEQELDKKLWRGLTLCSNFTLSQWGKAITALWDNSTSGDNNSYYVNNTTPEKIFFTVDLGVVSKLSRFRFWGRERWYFNLHHPKEFEIWGTDNPAVANAGPCEWNGWELLMKGTSTKPSGDNVLAVDALTSEDLALAAAGEEFEFPLEAPAVQYIRFRVLRTWTDSQNAHISELSFWGNVIK
jgi:hypothetical protein